MSKRGLTVVCGFISIVLVVINVKPAAAYVTPGMGGGTGTGAAPIVAQVAKEMGILTVAVVTKPFAFEGKRMSLAQSGIEELASYVDSLIIVPNSKLMEVLGGKTTLAEAFKAAQAAITARPTPTAAALCPSTGNSRLRYSTKSVG